MFSIRSCPLPNGALLARYLRGGGYADCFTTEIVGAITQAQFVSAFYTTWVFKLERWILSWAVSKPSTDAQAMQLAAGLIDAFAAWTLEDRSEKQLLMCDFQGRTRSWLMVAPGADGTDTRLYFGSAVVPKKSRTTDELRMGFVFRALLGFHQLYSIVLLAAARSRLLKLRRVPLP